MRRRYAQVREWLGGVLFRTRQSRELDEELEFHVDQEAARLERSGVPAAEARRRAAVVLGGVEKYKEQVRDAKGLGWVTGVSLDVRLGVRMLVKSWGLTLVGGLGMAVAIALGAAFHGASAVMDRPLPFEDGERIVAIEVWDGEASNQERSILHEYVQWREQLRGITELSAYRTVGRNLITAEGAAEPVRVAEMSAAGFDVPRVPALLGRTLIAEDEMPGAADVVVIGYDVWRTRFAGDPAILGREIQLGAARHTVVGVMPEGYAFPLTHSLWTPLRLDAAQYDLRASPGLWLFGRLASGVSLAAAQAELTAAGERLAAVHPDTHARLRPRVLPYTMQLFDDFEGWEVAAFHLLIALLLVVVCVNVAILVYARTATRVGEIAVRTALGASRRRIVGQLFVEALVLAGLAAAAGLLIARVALDRINVLLAGFGGNFGGLPFWIELRLTAGTVAYVLALTLVSAAIIGVIPALRVAGGRVQSSLRELGGATGLRLGGTWTLLIAAQVAVAVAFLPPAVSGGWKSLQHAAADPGFAAAEFLTAQLLTERVTQPTAALESYRAELLARSAEIQPELLRRLRAEPAVVAATYSLDVPGAEPKVHVSADGDVVTPDASGDGLRVRFARVDAGFFEAYDVPVLRGRGFHEGDVASDASVVVSRSLAQQLAGDGNVIGRRIRHAAGYRSGGAVRVPEGVEPERWYEIVGVVPDFPNRVDPDEVAAAVYHVMAPGQLHRLTLGVRVRGAPPASLTGRVRHIAAGVDPALQLHGVRSLDAVLREMQDGMRLIALALALLTASVLLLSAAGIYSLMSFTVSSRRREIGIRAALGAHPHRIVAAIFARALRQLALGAAAGLALALLLDVATGGELMSNRAVLLPGVAAFMMLVGLLAAVGPARHGLHIQPTEALRD